MNAPTRTPESAALAALAGFADRGVVSMHNPPRRGKTAALNRGVAAARGEILVFSDANNDFNPDALNALVQHFADPNIPLRPLIGMLEVIKAIIVGGRVAQHMGAQRSHFTPHKPNGLIGM